MKRTASLAIFTALLLVTGCAQLKRGLPAVGEHSSAGPLTSLFSRDDSAAQEDEVLMLLGYYQRMSNVNAEDLRKEFSAVNQVFSRDKTESARLKLVLLLSLPGASFRDDARLMNLLETSPSRALPAESPRHEFLTLLSRLTSERMRQVAAEREGVRKLESETKEEQRHAEEQQKRADELQKRADELQQKLDKLLAIDREMRRAPRRIPR